MKRWVSRFLLMGALVALGGAALAADKSGTVENAYWEAYWYSLYNLSSLSMGKSGMGIRFAPPPEKVAALLKAAGLKQPPLKNPYFVSVPYASGDPHFTQAWHADDGATWRWDPASFDKTVLVASVAYTNVKYVEWAKHFEDMATMQGISTPLNHFRGLMLNNLAATATGWLATNMHLPNGLYAHAWKGGAVTDDQARLADQWSMLLALASLDSVADPANHFQWYQAPLPKAKIQKLENGLFQSIAASGLVAKASFEEQARGVQALAWFVATTDDVVLQGDAASMIHALAARLRSGLQPEGQVSAASGSLAALDAGALAVKALGQAALVEEHYDGDGGAASQDRVAAKKAWSYLVDTLWDANAATFSPAAGASAYVYTPDRVADVVGAFNVAQHVLDLDVGGRFAAFFQATVNGSGLIAAQLPNTAGDHNGVPLPPKAGGQYGQAPVFLSGVSYDAHAASWSVSDGRFTTAQAMHLADELLWMGHWAGQPIAGPPAYGLPFAALRKGSG